MNEKVKGLVQSFWKPLVAILLSILCSWVLLTAFGYPAN